MNVSHSMMKWLQCRLTQLVESIISFGSEVETTLGDVGLASDDCGWFRAALRRAAHRNVRVSVRAPRTPLPPPTIGCPGKPRVWGSCEVHRTPPGAPSTSRLHALVEG